MKVAPVSGDLLVKLALLAGAAGIAVYAVRRASAAVSDAAARFDPVGSVTDVLYSTADYVGQAWTSGTINPASTNNVVYGGVNSVLFPAGDETLGTWLYGVFNDDPVMAVPATPAPSIWRTQGKWNNPSAFVADGYGGAAFGIYPKPF